MGGQACVLYGAAEFSRDTDLAILASPENLHRLQAALTALQARLIAVPPFELQYLERGHAIHFECDRTDTARMRVDVMSRLRGVDPFPVLWERRTTVELPDEGPVDVLALPDLVTAKKTQRDKDWPMIRRLVEVHYLTFRENTTSERITFWLRELRTPTMLIEAAGLFPNEATTLFSTRSLLRAAVAGDVTAVTAQLDAEETQERANDAKYWAPLRMELEQLRHAARKQTGA